MQCWNDRAQGECAMSKWAQQWVKDRGVAVRAEPTRTKCADLGTKVHSVARFRELFDMIKLCWIVTTSKQRPARRLFLCLFPLLELLIVRHHWRT